MSPLRVVVGLAAFQIPAAFLAALFVVLGGPAASALGYAGVLLVGSLFTFALETRRPLPAAAFWRRLLRYELPVFAAAQLPLALSAHASAVAADPTGFRVGPALLAYVFFTGGYLVLIALPVAFFAQWRVLSPPDREP